MTPPDQATASSPPAHGPPPLAVRVSRGLSRTSNWIQLLRFGVVGGTGYMVNLVVFAAAVHLLNVGHSAGATLAFTVAVTNNFFWNRMWTFSGREGRVETQALRFLTVSLLGFVANLVFLELLLRGAAIGDVPAQAIAVALAMR